MKSEANSDCIRDFVSLWRLTFKSNPTLIYNKYRPFHECCCSKVLLKKLSSYNSFWELPFDKHILFWRMGFVPRRELLIICHLKLEVVATIVMEIFFLPFVSFWRINWQKYNLLRNLVEMDSREREKEGDKAMRLPKIFGLSTFTVFRVSQSFDCQKFSKKFPCFWQSKLSQNRNRNYRNSWHLSKIPKIFKNFKNWRFLSKISLKNTKISLKNVQKCSKISTQIFGLRKFLVLVSTVKRDQNFWPFFAKGGGFSKKSTGVRNSYRNAWP